MEKNFKSLPKETQCFFIISAVVASFLFIVGADSIVDAGFFGFILGTMECALIGMIIGLVSTVVYVIANAIAPKKAEDIINKLTTEPKEDYFSDETNED